MYPMRMFQLSRYRSRSRSCDPFHAPVDVAPPYRARYCSCWLVSLLIKLSRTLPMTVAKDFAAICCLPLHRLMFEVLAAAECHRAVHKEKSDEAATSPPLGWSPAPVEDGNRGFYATRDAVAAGLVSIVFARSRAAYRAAESKRKGRLPHCW